MWLVSIYTIYIYTFKCMYVCICKYVHVPVCHAYVVWHVYTYTCVYLFRVDLHRNPHPPPHCQRKHVRQLRVSSRFLNSSDPREKHWVYCFGDKKSDFETKGGYLCLPGESLLEGEGNGNYRNTTVPVSVPGSIPRNYEWQLKHTSWYNL